MNFRLVFLISIVFFISISTITNFSYAELIFLNAEYYVDVYVDMPESVVKGEIFPISILIQNDSSYNSQTNMTVTIDYPKSVFKPLSDNSFFVSTLSPAGTVGKTLYFEVLPTARSGDEYINIHYQGDSDIFDRAQKIHIKSGPALIINVKTSDSIFIDAEFPFEVIITPQGTDVTDVTVQLIPPQDIEFRGETLHSFSLIEKDDPISMRSQLITRGQGEVSSEHYLPFQIIVKYTNNDNEEKTETKTIPILLRPRTSFEWGPDGGFWIGDFFVAPYISIGTFVGAPLGLVLTWIIKRMRKKKTEV